MYSILSSGRGQLNQALDSYGMASQIEQEREQTEDNIDAANSAQNSQAIGTVAGVGAQYALGGSAAPAATSTVGSGGASTVGSQVGSGVTTGAGGATGSAAVGGTAGTAGTTGGSAAGGSSTGATAFGWLFAIIAGKATHDISNDYYSGQDALTGRALVKNFDRKYEEQGNEAIEGLGSGGKLAASVASWDFKSAKEATEDGGHSIGYQLLKKVF